MSVRILHAADLHLDSPFEALSGAQAAQRRREQRDLLRALPELAKAHGAQIILLGQTATVEAGTVKDETWYRVLVGPFSNRDQLTVAQKQLAGSGFSNLLLQQRR